MKKSEENKNNFQVVNPHAGGIDVGSMEHYVAILTEEQKSEVKCFSTFTPDLEALAEYLVRNKVDTVAMESTGNYWIPLYTVLERHGIKVCLTNARTLKNVSGRKTDVSDCQWIQKLHTFGLLGASFIPDEATRELREFVRQRETIEKEKSRDMQLIGKALGLMNIKLQHVVSDLEGVSAMLIIRDIAGGVTDAKSLVNHRDKKMKASIEELELSLTGNYSYSHVFMLRQYLTNYDLHKRQLLECDKEIEDLLKAQSAQLEQSQGVESLNKLEEKIHKARKNEYTVDVKKYLRQIYGVDLTAVEGLKEKTLLTILSEVGSDLHSWRTEKHWTSWLRLCPNPEISGGKVLGHKNMKTDNRVSKAFRLGAQSLHHSNSPLGVFYRRISSKYGGPTAIKATARKLAIIFYKMVKNGTEYVRQNVEEYTAKCKEQFIKTMEKKAKKFGLELKPIEGIALS